MFKVSLATYTIRVLDKAQAIPRRVDAFGNMQDLLDVLMEFFESLKSKSANNPEARALLSVIEVRRDGRTISGLIESGLYGRGSRLRHVEDSRVTYKRSAEEADMLPFYFLIDVPEMTDEAFLILERAGNIGIRKILGMATAKFFETRLPEFTLRLAHVGRGDVVKSYLEGGDVTAIHFVHFGLPSDFADALPTGHKEGTGTLELIARPSRGKPLLVRNRIKKYIQGDLDLNRFIELESFNYDTVKLDVSQTGGSSRTIDLNRLKIRGFYDVSAHILRDPQGNPTFDSIDAQARKLMQELKAGSYASANTA